MHVGTALQPGTNQLRRGAGCPTPWRSSTGMNMCIDGVEPLMTFGGSATDTRMQPTLSSPCRHRRPPDVLACSAAGRPHLINTPKSQLCAFPSIPTRAPVVLNITLGFCKEEYCERDIRFDLLTRLCPNSTGKRLLA
jgi:hypothetical protein